MLHNFLKASNTLYCMMDILNILLIVMHDKLRLKIKEVALGLTFYHPRMRVGNVFGRVCLCVCLCVCLSVCVSVCSGYNF